MSTLFDFRSTYCQCRTNAGNACANRAVAEVDGLQLCTIHRGMLDVRKFVPLIGGRYLVVNPDSGYAIRDRKPR